ncbi:hypothetical protein AAG570_007263 [Ranatra chinensis]|uniref:Cytochrome c oxidase polypeptide VIa n=1 Tax=Ranatra chinensis TaxID=642074 RepID=A0ABD0XVC9_9HEMI
MASIRDAVLPGVKRTVWSIWNRKVAAGPPCMDTPACCKDTPPRPRRSTNRLYQLLSLFFALPIVMIVTSAQFYGREEQKRPPFIPYSYLRLKTRRYPWGDGEKTFFHNPKMNALKDGYETEDEEDKE